MPYRAADQVPPRRKRGLQECNACHAMVLPTAERECPACRRNVDEVPDDGRRMITVRDGEELPGVCARCGSATERRVALRCTRTDPSSVGQALWLRIAIVLVWPVLLLFTKAKKRERVATRLPLCAGCAALDPEHVDFAQRELSLLVHRRLHAALSERRA